jgi:predicted cupin superfamily sugar epimerase
MALHRESFGTIEIMKKQASIQEIISKLNLVPLEKEGGYFRLNYRSENSSAIFYLLTPADFSALHRLTGDEVFHFYAGDAVEMIQITESGDLKQIRLGSDFMNGMEPQVIVPAKVWQGTRLAEGGKWALLGTTMAPRFEYEDFELGYREKLIELFPKFADQIKVFTR